MSFKKVALPEIAKLYQSKRTLMREENFVEAQNAANKINELQRRHREESMKELREKQKTDLQVIEKAFEDELKEFHSRWDAKLQGLIESTKAQQ